VEIVVRATSLLSRRRAQPALFIMRACYPQTFVPGIGLSQGGANRGTGAENAGAVGRTVRRLAEAYQSRTPEWNPTRVG
jgi:hypothetical protein